MNFWKLILFISLFIVFYNYIGYAVLAFLLNKFKRKNIVNPNSLHFPSVSFIVAAFNEEYCIEEKINNSLAQVYPPHLIEFIFITDGSSDNTSAIIQRFTGIKLLHQPERKGKSAALNRAVSIASNDILIFSDANTNLNIDAVQNITRHYQDAKIGGVAGEKKVISVVEDADEISDGEGVYWKYESFLKKIDSEFYSVVGAAGELFSLRRKLYEPVSNEIILDDFVISLRVAQKGYRIIYEPDAYAIETPSFSVLDEKKRKERIAAGGFQAMLLLYPLLYFWKYPKLSFLYISHRVLRWTLSPLCLIVIFIANFILVCKTDNYFYTSLFLSQLIFYTMALIPFIFPKSGRWKFFKLPYYFAFMNISVILGFIKFLKGKQSAIWEKSKRS